ncbi:MAG: DUF2905 domain-containing protein [Patescibacteria group bacterium]|nr:DUF2905 domain-containing protein [Patescibacteria group bacterium]
MFPLQSDPNRVITFWQWLQAFGLIYVISIGIVYYLSARTKVPIVIPGDIYVRKAGRTMYIPLSSPLVVAIIIFVILRKFLGY